ncbi:MAG TPA: methyltransferase domain-containing protein [Blastocatellia bacterium]|nr:methyltransferase domain-containing protein [Blastocatellia bacterium]
MSDNWNPLQYERFRDERSQPFFDLLALVEARPEMRVVDLGCGTGELTRALHQRLSATETLGLDSSSAMLAKSQSFAGLDLRFEQRDIAEFAAAGEYDLIFSNAALHWLEDHERLLACLTAALRAGGQIAVQVPANDDHPTHVVAAELARQSPFREAMRGYERRWPVLKPEAYAALLHRLGYKKQHVRLQVYGHLLGARDEVIEWVKGTLLTDYEKRLPAELFAEFMRQYRERLFERLEDARPYFYPFKRILFWAGLG